MSANYIDAEMLKKMFISGAYNLEANKEWINELNVFPVPDGDTGTNMTLTILSAVNEVNELDNNEMSDISKAISHGSLRGARGNSGVILSQLLRGLSKEIQNCSQISTEHIARAFERAVETAYKAVMRPKEGTILTVAKGMAKKANSLLKEKPELGEYLKRIIEEGDKVLAATPDMLPVLKEAGVVDSGGQGLMVILKGAYEAFLGNDIKAPAHDNEKKSAPTVKTEVNRPIEDIKFGYCTEFIINLAEPVTERQVEGFKGFLESMGDSIVCVPDDDFIKIHVHTNDPGTVLHKAVSFGELSRIKIDNMREEHREMLGLDASAVKTEKKSADTKPEEKMKKYGFITVAAGEGFDQLFADMNVDVVINGGQTMNPSTDDFLNAINSVNASNIFIFPNNKNIIMAANQARDLSEDKVVIVIPTKTVTQGITAMINFAAEYSPEENEEIMKSGIESVLTSQITYSIRDTHVDDFEIKSGDIMAVGDHSILSVGKDIDSVAVDSISKIINDESELISIYYGEGYTKEQAEALGAMVEEEYPDCAVEIQYGGQPVYYCIISVE